ncbi:unnamed protein product [Ilex paraguariensis]|uniref:Uncharacterized protein n=1 Tax=Ilex paraguariensis TaxID=185542 RepID=A0ABC8TUW3_9AQUA
MLLVCDCNLWLEKDRDFVVMGQMTLFGRISDPLLGKEGDQTLQRQRMRSKDPMNTTSRSCGCGKEEMLRKWLVYIQLILLRSALSRKRAGLPSLLLLLVILVLVSDLILAQSRTLYIIECESIQVDASSIALPLSILLRSSTSGRAAGKKERLFDSNQITKNILENEVADASLPFRRVAHDSLPFNTSSRRTSGISLAKGKLFSPELTEFKTSSRSIEKVQQVRKNPFHGGFLQLVPLLLRAVLRLKKLNKGLTGACRKNGCCGNSGQVAFSPLSRSVVERLEASSAETANVADLDIDRTSLRVRPEADVSFVPAFLPAKAKEKAVEEFDCIQKAQIHNLSSETGHPHSIGGMPESAQSEVAARPEAAEVSFYLLLSYQPRRKNWNFPQLLTNGLQGENKLTRESPTGRKSARAASRSSATSSTADPSGDQRAASQSTQFSDLDLKEGGLEVKEAPTMTHRIS